MLHSARQRIITEKHTLLIMNFDALNRLESSVHEAADRLAIAENTQKLAELTEQSTQPGFWDDNRQASDVMQQINQLGSIVDPWNSILTDIKDLKELVALNDESLKVDIEQQVVLLEERYEVLKKELRYSGPFDNHDAILSIHAGAGGTDAQDWAEMLLRMYTRWGEGNGLKVVHLEDSPGEEAGIKSANIEFSGPHAYAKLKGEHGVHRLVRLSPFNADAKRQTSFAKVEVLPKIDAPDEVPVDDADLKIDVFRSGGKGGQSVNTTDSAVRVTHLPTGIVVSIQNERSQLQNKETAMTILRSKLAQLQLEQHKESLAEIKGPNQSAEWGNQIRSYVLHPYTMVKDLRTRHETTNAEAVLAGDLDPFIEACLETLSS